MGFSAFFRAFLKFFLGSLLLACSGALNSGPGLPGGEVGGPLAPVGGNLNAADGTLPSQSGYQELDNGCGSPYTARFSDEVTEVKTWLIRDNDPSYFPKAKVEVAPHDEVKDYAPCLDCQGKVLRLVDLGEMPPAGPSLSAHKMRLGTWMIGLYKDSWDPALLPQIRYQEFALNAAGEADLSGQEILENHLYWMLLSKQVATPVTSWTPFSSIQELYDLTSCVKIDNPAPFHALRLLQVLDHKPIQLNPGQYAPAAEEEEDDNDKILIQVPHSERLRKLQ